MPTTSPRPRLGPTDVCAPRPPDPAPSTADPELAADIAAAIRVAQAAKRRKLWVGGAGLSAGGAAVVRYALALAQSVEALRGDVRAARAEMRARADSTNAAVSAAMTLVGRFECKRDRAEATDMGIPCPRIYNDGRWPLFGAAAPGLAPVLSVSLPVSLPAFAEVSRAARE